MEVIGIRRLDIDRDGKNIHGYMLHCHDEDIQMDYGIAVDKFFVSDRICNNASYSPTLGDNIMPIYPKGSNTLKTIMRLD